jgi:hypothetical protein
MKSDYLKAQNDCDKAFSAYIKQKAKGICEVHTIINKKGIVGFPVKSCSETKCCNHIIPKAQSHALRYDERNAVWACSGLNRWEQSNRNTWFEWLPVLFPERIEYLQSNKKGICKRNTAMLKLMTLNFKQKCGE